jgi:hypothetical protein
MFSAGKIWRGGMVYLQGFLGFHCDSWWWNCGELVINCVVNVVKKTVMFVVSECGTGFSTLFFGDSDGVLFCMGLADWLSH